MLLRLSEWLERLHWKIYYWRHPEGQSLVRSEVWSKAIKELLLQDMNSQKFKGIING